MTASIPRLYLGTMTFGWSQTSSKVTEPISLELMNRFVDFQTSYIDSGDNDLKSKIFIDTARIYAGGKTEQILGSTLSKIHHDLNSFEICVGTKAHPSQPNGLSKEGIMTQFQNSLDSMNIEQVEEFYLHQPDTEHSLLQSLQTAHELVQTNKINCIGMSNYHVTEVKRAFQLCEEYSLTKPSIYQGLYNPLNRMVEEELLPLLRENDCAFVAYNPLAAGLLTGKHKREDLETNLVKKGRFQNNQNYLPRFFTHSNFDALHIIQSACDNEGISLIEASFRWLLCHSSLRAEKKDGIVLGFSSMAQLDENLNGCQAAITSNPLSKDILKAFDEAWCIVKEKGCAFPYWRSYSSDMPDRENLDHGASYSANKVK